MQLTFEESINSLEMKTLIDKSVAEDLDLTFRAFLEADVTNNNSSKSSKKQSSSDFKSRELEDMIDLVKPKNEGKKVQHKSEDPNNLINLMDSVREDNDFKNPYRFEEDARLHGGDN